MRRALINRRSHFNGAGGAKLSKGCVPAYLFWVRGFGLRLDDEKLIVRGKGWCSVSHYRGNRQWCSGVISSRSMPECGFCVLSQAFRNVGWSGVRCRKASNGKFDIYLLMKRPT